MKKLTGTKHLFQATFLFADTFLAGKLHLHAFTASRTKISADANKPARRV